MRHALLFSTFILTFTCIELNAQDSLSARNSISLEYGLHHLADQDLIFSPFVLDDIAPFNISAAWKHTGKFNQIAEVYFDSFDPTYQNTFTYYTNPDSEATETIRDDFTFVRINYGFGKTIRNSEKYSFMVGGMTENTVIAKYYYAGYFSTFGYFASFALSPWAELNYHLDEKNTIQAGVHFPLVTWVCRSPYLANDDQFIENTASHKSVKTFFAYLHDGNLQTFNTMQQFDLKATYTYSISKKFDAGISYHFTFINNSIPLKYASVQNAFNLQATFKF